MYDRTVPFRHKNELNDADLNIPVLMPLYFLCKYAIESISRMVIVLSICIDTLF